MDIQKKIFIGFMACLLILFAGSYTGYHSMKQLITTSSWVAHTYEVEMLIGSAITQLNDAETGQRGYLLTGNTIYLEPYERGISKIITTLARAKILTIDNPKQQKCIEQIEILTKKKLSELKETIDLYNAGNQADAIDLILTHRGKQLMDDIRTIINDMKSEEQRLLVERQQDFKTAIQSTIIIILIGSVLAFTFIGFISVIIRRDTRQYITERDQSENDLRYIATHDALTGLYNRISLSQRLNDEIHRATRYNHLLSAFMIDIDHFKSINDTYGHQTGDMILHNFARLLEISIRSTDYAARYGGEEFVIILPETPLLKAEELAERLRSKIDEHTFTIESDKDINLTASIGIATFPEHAQTSQDLIEVADSAMYAAKKAGRNQVKTP